MKVLIALSCLLANIFFLYIDIILIPKPQCLCGKTALHGYIIVFSFIYYMFLLKPPHCGRFLRVRIIYVWSKNICSKYDNIPMQYIAIFHCC